MRCLCKAWLLSVYVICDTDIHTLIHARTDIHVHTYAQTRQIVKDALPERYEKIDEIRIRTREAQHEADKKGYQRVPAEGETSILRFLNELELPVVRIQTRLCCALPFYFEGDLICGHLLRLV